MGLELGFVRTIWHPYISELRRMFVNNIVFVVSVYMIEKCKVLVNYMQ